jgi:hypothetical protein
MPTNEHLHPCEGTIKTRALCRVANITPKLRIWNRGANAVSLKVSEPSK